MATVVEKDPRTVAKNSTRIAINITIFTVTFVVCCLLLEGVAWLYLNTGTQGDYRKIVRNSRGLRDPREASDVAGKQVILMLGDSFTYGLGVAYEESFPAQLEVALREAAPNSVVITAGWPGFDTEMAFDRLRDVYEDYKPKYVVLAFHSGDIVQNQVALRLLNQKPKDTSKAAQSIDEAIKRSESQLPTLFLVKEYLRKNTQTVRVINYMYKNSWIKFVPPPDDLLAVSSSADGDDQFRASEFFLDQINDFLVERDARLVLTSAVPLIRFDAFPYRNLLARLDGFAQSRDAYFVNPLPEFSKYRSADLWVSRRDGHYNARGNRAMSTALGDFFVTNELLDTP